MSIGHSIGNGKVIVNDVNRRTLIDYSVGAPPIQDLPVEPSQNNLYKNDFHTSLSRERANHPHTFLAQVAKIVRIFHHEFMLFKTALFRSCLYFKYFNNGGSYFGGLFILDYLNSQANFYLSVYRRP